MICPRGSLVSEKSHKVSTLAKAVEWWPYVQESHLPVTVTQYEAKGGRLRIEMYDKNNKMIHARG